MARDKSAGLKQLELERSFREGSFQPLYLLHGEEDLLIDEVVDALVGAALDPSARSFNLDLVDGASADGKDVVSLASAYPMMGGRRVVVVRDFDQLADRERMNPIVERPVPSTILVLTASKPDFRLKTFKLLAQHAVVAQFPRLYDNEITAWIRERVGRLGKTATPEACQLVQAYVGRSLREVRNEIEKLFIYIGDKPTIDADDVNAIVGMSRQFNIFELQRAIGSRSLGQATEIVLRMLDAGEHPIGIIVKLTGYFKTLWRVLDARPRPGADRSDTWSAMSPSRFRDYEEASRRYSPAQVEECFRALLDADGSLKLSGSPRLVMAVLMNRIIRQDT